MVRDERERRKGCKADNLLELRSCFCCRYHEVRERRALGVILFHSRPVLSHVSVKARKRLGSNGCQFAPHHPPRKSDSRRSPVPTHTNFRLKQLKLRRDFLYDILTNVARKNRRIVSAYHWHPALLPLSTMATPNIHMGRVRDQTPNDRGQMRLAATVIAIVDTTTP
jgi:hypothetical protein